MGRDEEQGLVKEAEEGIPTRGRDEGGASEREE